MIYHWVVNGEAGNQNHGDPTQQQKTACESITGLVLEHATHKTKRFVGKKKAQPRTTKKGVVVKEGFCGNPKRVEGGKALGAGLE